MYEILVTFSTYCRLVPIALINSASLNTAAYSISGFSFCSNKSDEEGHVVIRIQFDRKLLGFTLTTCLPTLISIIIGHITNFFGHQSFDNSIGVNLTLLLVITTM